MKSIVCCSMFAVVAAACLSVCAETRTEAPRDLPLIADVDVVVAGGGFAAVGAALAAHAAGASVFVVMPRQNPADDLVTTRRLWAQEGDEGLDDALLATTIPMTHQTAFTYTPSIEATNAAHLDAHHTVLRDGAWGSDEKQTVQYDGAVDIAIVPQEGDYNVTSVTVHYHVKSNYGSAGFKVLVGGEEVKGSESSTANSAYRTWVFTPTVPFARSEFTLHSECSEGAVRQLLGEVIVETDGAFATPASTPVRYFKALDAALREAGIEYFTGAVVTDVLRDAAGDVSGVVIANRSGRQAIRAKAVVDATEWGNAARRAARLRVPASGGETAFTRVMTVSSDATFEGLDDIVVREVPLAVETATILPNDLHPTRKSFNYALKAVAFTKRLPFNRTDARAVTAIDQSLRGETWERTVVDQSEKPFFVPPESIISAAGPVTAWPGANEMPLGAFRPEGAPYLWVSGMMADVDRSLAEKLSFPGVGVIVGRRIGAAAAEEALARGTMGEVVCGEEQALAAADIREALLRPLNVGNVSDGAVRSLGGAVEVLDDVDVLVVGGGTAGGPAAIAAAREGKKTMVAEWLYTMGGVTTEGRIGRYYKATTRGFTKNEVDPHAMGDKALGDCFYEAKSEFFRRTAVEAGAEILFGAFAEGALVEGTDAAGRAKVRGAVLVLPDGTRGIVRAKVVIDATGNADVAAAAGAETMFLSPAEFAMQGTAASTHVLGDSYRNSDVGFLNTPDAGDMSHFAKRARRGMPESAWNLSNIIAGSRERRRIVGDFIVTELDEMRGRTYPDTIMHGESNYDMHGYSTSDLMMFYETTHGAIFKADLPYRALLPASLDGVYATGLAISATRDAMPIIRMQPSVQNQGYAAGLAAAMAADAGSVRAIDVKALQRRLVDDGCLDARVLTDEDSGDDRSGLADAVRALGADFHGMEFVLSFPGDALPLLQAAYGEETEISNKVAKAAALLMLGDNRGFDVVTNALAASAWLAGNNFRGLGNFGRQTAFDDCLLFALACSGDTRAPGVLADYANRLADADGKTVRALSHWRMLAQAAERQRSGRIAANIGLAAERASSKVEGFAKKGTPDAVSYAGENANDGERTNALRELAELRARYRFGDKAAEARLREYLNDYRTIYAAWAALVLSQPPLGEVVGEWTDANTLVIDLGKPSAPNTYTGVVEVSDATLRFLSEADEAPVSDSWRFSLVPGGDFEPLEVLSGATTAALDKRAKRDAAWLAANVPDWTFDNSNDGSGLTKDGSYFASDNRIGARGHAAFLFKTSNSGGLGPVSQPFTVPEGGGDYALAFDWTSRYNAGTTYPVQIVVSLDGVALGTYGGAQKYDSWQTQVVELGTLAAGQHTLAFSIPNVNNTGVLIDNVKLGVPAEPATAAQFPADLLKALTVKVTQETNLELLGDFRLQVRAFYRDGAHWIGEVVATLPDGGDGVLVSKPFPFVIRLV